MIEDPLDYAVRQLPMLGDDPSDFTVVDGKDLALGGKRVQPTFRLRPVDHFRIRRAQKVVHDQFAEVMRECHGESLRRQWN